MRLPSSTPQRLAASLSIVCQVTSAARSLDALAERRRLAAFVCADWQPRETLRSFLGLCDLHAPTPEAALRQLLFTFPFLPIDVDEIGCDFLSATGRKYLRGPRGTGFLYARPSILDRVTPSQPDHHGAKWSSTDDYTFAAGAQRFEYWEFSHAGWLGLGAAVDVVHELGIDRIEATVTERANQLRTMLTDLGLTVYDEGLQRCGIVTTASPNVASADLKAALSRCSINASTTFAGSSRYDVERRNLPDMLRLSVHCTTTVDELEWTVAVLTSILRN